MPPVNDNTMKLSQFHGEIRPCPLCTRLTPNAALDALMSGKSCKLCFEKKFIAMCTNCDGTGQYKGAAVWDGGKTSHTSVCTPCGGSGAFAIKKPDNWVEPTVATEVVENQASIVT
jgi:hypothetical protein